MKTSPISIREIDHVVLRSRDVQRLQKFYCDVLGCDVEKIQPAVGLIQLRAGRSLIDLFDVTIARNQHMKLDDGRNMDHFCLRIEPWDAKAIGEFLRGHGIDPGKVASRYGAEGEGPSIYIDDPDGNTVELKGPPGVTGD